MKTHGKPIGKKHEGLDTRPGKHLHDYGLNHHAIKGKTHVISTGPFSIALCNKLPQGMQSGDV